MGLSESMFFVLDQEVVNHVSWAKFSPLSVTVGGVFISNTATPIHHRLSVAALSYKVRAEPMGQRLNGLQNSFYYLTFH